MFLRLLRGCADLIYVPYSWRSSSASCRHIDEAEPERTLTWPQRSCICSATHNQCKPVYAKQESPPTRVTRQDDNTQKTNLYPSTTKFSTQKRFLVSRPVWNNTVRVWCSGLSFFPIQLRGADWQVQCATWIGSFGKESQPWSATHRGTRNRPHSRGHRHWWHCKHGPTETKTKEEISSMLTDKCNCLSETQEVLAQICYVKDRVESQKAKLTFHVEDGL